MLSSAVCDGLAHGVVVGVCLGWCAGRGPLRLVFRETTSLCSSISPFALVVGLRCWLLALLLRVRGGCSCSLELSCGRSDVVTSACGCLSCVSSVEPRSKCVFRAAALAPATAARAVCRAFGAALDAVQVPDGRPLRLWSAGASVRGLTAAAALWSAELAVGFGVEGLRGASRAAM